MSSWVRAALGPTPKLYRQQYARSGLRMNNVLPGLIETYPADEAARAALPAGQLGRPTRWPGWEGSWHRTNRATSPGKAYS